MTRQVVKLCASRKMELQQLRADGWTYSQLCKRYGVTSSYVYAVLFRERRQAYDRMRRAQRAICRGCPIRPYEKPLQLKFSVYGIEFDCRKLTCTHCRMLLLLAVGHRGIVSNHAFVDMLWGDAEDGGPANTNRNIQVHMVRLRQIVEPLGLKIENSVKLGYRLIEAEKPAMEYRAAA